MSYIFKYNYINWICIDNTPDPAGWHEPCLINREEDLRKFQAVVYAGMNHQ